MTAGSYAIGFVDPQGVYATEYYPNGRMLESVAPLDMEHDSQLTDINASLSLDGGIEGQVRYPDGTPVENVAVTIFWNSPELGWLGFPETKTDEQGRYRVQGLFPDTYRLYFDFFETNPQVPGYFYGNTREISAAADIAVEAGEVTSQIDLTIPMSDRYLPIIQR